VRTAEVLHETAFRAQSYGQTPAISTSRRNAPTGSSEPLIADTLPRGDQYLW
jgi:hypothetical protein